MISMIEFVNPARIMGRGARQNVAEMLLIFENHENVNFVTNALPM